jgi:GDP-L-fucose synthase
MNSMFDLEGKSVWVAGHNGMVGSAIVRKLRETDIRVLTVDRSELDLTDATSVGMWVADKKPDCIVLAAAKVGGIQANREFPVQFLQDNLLIQANVLKAAHEADVARLLFLGSSCIYPKFAEQPITEDSLLTGPLEPTNQWYAIAKIAGIKLCEAYREQYGRRWISAMPTNLYGPGDNYDLKTSHVLPALIRKFHEAKQAGIMEVEIWGSGEPLREFMHCDDLADATVFLLERYDDAAPINIGSGEEVSIRALADIINLVVGGQARIKFNKNMPDGTPRKLMSSEKLTQLGWRSNISIRAGIKSVYSQLERSNFSEFVDPNQKLKGRIYVS